MNKTKKVYFVDPSGGFEIYYMLFPEDTDISTAKKISIGYNDSYEMRSQFLSSKWFSDDIEKVKDILRERKATLIAKKYKEMIDIMEIDIDGEPYLHDSIDAPF